MKKITLIIVAVIFVFCMANQSFAVDNEEMIKELTAGIKTFKEGIQTCHERSDPEKCVKEYNYLIASFQAKLDKIQSETKGEKAYKADCGVVDPNRTKPFPPDQNFCPGNLVCMTNFCGGGTGCPYVCCPKGLPYLNHCDCKCYATPDFDCHSYSNCKEKP